MEESHHDFVFFQMELDSKDLMIDRLNSQNKQRALNTSINENDDVSVSGRTVIRIVHYFKIFVHPNVEVSRNVSHR